MKHPHLIGFLICLILSCVLPELALQLIDPLGVKPYFADIEQLFASMGTHPTRTYALTPGEYTFSDWTLSVNPDATRYVPDTDAAACLIAFVGDSVTLGHGVNDNETWVNRIAQRFPNIVVVNAGVNGYNAPQVLATIQETPATGYFYTLVSNDADPIHNWRPTPQNRLYAPLLPVYLYVLGKQQEPAHMRDIALFDEALTLLRDMPNVVIVGFGDDPLAQRAGVETIPYWRSVNSPVDGHANAVGNIEIADAMMPYVARLITRTCVE